MDLYHAALLDRGVEGYSREDCLTDYRYGLLQKLTFWVPVLAFLDFTTPRGAALVTEILARLDAAVRDHDPAALLPA